MLNMMTTVLSGSAYLSYYSWMHLQVDGAYAAVKFQVKDAGDLSAPLPGRSGCSGGGGGGGEDVSSLLQDCRLLRKDELQVVKGSSSPRIPDCFQKTPKKVTVVENAHILSVSVDCDGEKMSYKFYLKDVGIGMDSYL